MIDRSQRYAARVFAITYLLTLVIITVGYSRFYAPCLVWDNEVQTAVNFASHAGAIHIYIGCAVIYGAGLVVMLAALYRILRPAGPGLAFFAALSHLMYAWMWFAGLLDLFGALRIMGGGSYLHVFEPERLQAMAALQLASGWDTYYIGLTFYGIGSALFSYLFFQSRYVPRFLAIFGIVSSLFEGACGFAYLNDRSFDSIVSVNWYEMPVMFFEVIISIWILVRGLRSPEMAKTIGVSN